MIFQFIATPRSLCIAIARSILDAYGYKIMCLKVFESSFSSSVILAVKHLFSDSSFMIAWAESSEDEVSLDFKSSSSPFRSRIESSSARSETSLISGYFILSTKYNQNHCQWFSGTNNIEKYRKTDVKSMKYPKLSFAFSNSAWIVLRVFWQVFRSHE